MPGRIVRRMAKGAVGVWTKVHFPNGDRVMVSMDRRDIKLYKISRSSALFGRETLATIDIASREELARTSAANVRAELIARGIDAQAAAQLVAPGGTPTEILDTTTALVAFMGQRRRSTSVQLQRGLDALSLMVPST